MTHRGKDCLAGAGARGVGWPALLALLIGVCVSSAHAQTVYFTRDEAGDANDEVFQVNEAGVMTPVSTMDKVDPKDVVADYPRSRVYWTENGQILRTPMYATNGPVDVIASGLVNVKGIQVVERDGSLVWIADGKIWLLRSGKINPIDVSQFIATKSGGTIVVGTPENIAVHHRTLFWTDSANQRIGKATQSHGVLDASYLITGLASPRGVAVDVTRDRLYWTELGSDSVKRSNLNGGGVATFLTQYAGTALVNPQDVEVDKKTGVVYVTDSGNDRVVSVTFQNVEVNTFGTGGAPVGVGLQEAAVPSTAGLLSSFGKPGSVLIFPYVNGDAGKTLITITNTNGSHIYCGDGTPDIFEGTVRVKLLFIHGPNCAVGNIIITLTPNDTFSAFVDEINLGGFGEEGWILAAAVSALDDSDTGLPQMIDYDFLIGSAQVYVSDQNVVWGYDAYSFRGLTEREPGEDTDDCGHVFTDDHATRGDGDGRIDFNDNEYDAFPLVQAVPRILEQPLNGTIGSFLGVMATNRGPGDESEVEVRIFDNEEDVVSIDFDIRCLRAGDLVDEFNFQTVRNLNGGPDPNGFPEREDAGWLLMWINEPYDQDTPAILAVFAQLNDNQTGLWIAGNNVFKEPAVLRRKQITSFDLDLQIND